MPFRLRFAPLPSAAQVRFAAAAAPVGNAVEQRFGGFSTAGSSGQFAVGLLLGAVWSPCVGAALPMLVFGTLAREVLMRRRDRMIEAGKGAKAALGVVLVALAHPHRRRQGDRSSSPPRRRG